MNREIIYKSDDDDDDDIGEDLDDLRLACIVSEPNSSVRDSDSEEEDDFEMLRSIKSQLAPSSMNSIPLDSENEDDDFEMLRSIKNQLELLMDDEEDGAFDTLCAIRRRFSSYANLNDVQRNLMNDSSRINNQVHASDNEPWSEILSRSNTCERGNSLVVTVLDTEEVHEDTSIDRATSTSFPESAQALVGSIRINRSYQAFLRKKLTEIESTIEQNEKHKKNVVIVRDFQASCKRITKQALSQSKDPRIELISTNTSKGNDKKTSSTLTVGPPENSCVANYKMAFDKYRVSVNRKVWTKKENENLAKGLKQQIQETLIREATNIELEGDLNTILEGINNLEITPEMIRQFLPQVNWDQLDIKNRSAAECEARWMSSEDPLINDGTWTKAEDNYIREIVRNNSFTDWLDVAVSLGTNRTPFQCLVRYQRSLNPNILEKDWTKDDYNKFRAAVALYGNKDWQSVANTFQGRTGTQCSNKLKCRERANWSLEEVERLKIARYIFGAKNWHQIAQFVPGRTGSQCEAKWKDTLNPNVNRGKWTVEEDAKLIQVTKEHGILLKCKVDWVKIASYIPRRTRKQCKKRWESLNRREMPLIKKVRQLIREATVGNFVDRESERPDIDMDDYLTLAEKSLEQEQPRIVAPKRKYKPRQKKLDVAAKERQPKRRRKGDLCENEANNAGEVRYLEWQNEFQDYVNENKQRETLPNNSSVIKKLKPMRKVSTQVVPIENQDPSTMH